MENVLDLLLSNATKKPPEREYKINRLSRDLGVDIVFTLKALSYQSVTDIRRMDESEQSIHIILKGTVSPDLKDDSLLAKYGVVTPAELLKQLLLPGEIDELALRIEKLSGFKTNMTEEVKKK
jgi:hypothetical protein